MLEQKSFQKDVLYFKKTNRSQQINKKSVRMDALCYNYLMPLLQTPVLQHGFYHRIVATECFEHFAIIFCIAPG